MIFLPGSLEAGQSMTSDHPPASVRHLLIPAAEYRYVHGPFGYYLSQVLKTAELDFYLHHFFVEAGTSLFLNTDTPVTMLHHFLKGNTLFEPNGGTEIMFSEKVSHFISLPGGVRHRVDFTGDPVVSAHFNYHDRFMADALLHYPVLSPVLPEDAGNGSSHLAVTHSYVEQYLWNSFVPLLRGQLKPHAFIPEKGRELLRLYCQGLQRLKEQVSGSNELIPGRDIDLARAVKTLIEADLTHHYTTTELARSCGWNAHRLKGVFPQIYGMTPYQYLVKCRMEFGKHLVLSTHDLLHTVALACGYREEHHFIKLFKKMYGITPGKMRERGG